MLGIVIKVLRIFNERIFLRFTQHLTPNLREKKTPLIQTILRDFRKRKMRILDLGSGKHYSINISNFPRRAEVYALDLRPPRSPTSVKGDVSATPFKQKVFDVVIASELLEHVPSPPKVIKEIIRIMKPDGIAIITTPWLWELLYQPHFQLFSYPILKRYLKSKKYPNFYQETLKQTIRLIENGNAHISWHSPLYWRRLFKRHFEQVDEIGIPIRPLVGYTYNQQRTLFTASSLVYKLTGVKFDVCKQRHR